MKCKMILATVLLSERANEEKFSIPYDDDRTRAIPAIKDSNRFESVVDTRKIEPVQPEEQPVAVVKKK